MVQSFGLITCLRIIPGGCKTGISRKGQYVYKNARTNTLLLLCRDHIEVWQCTIQILAVVSASYDMEFRAASTDFTYFKQ